MVPPDGAGGPCSLDGKSVGRDRGDFQAALAWIWPGLVPPDLECNSDPEPMRVSLNAPDVHVQPLVRVLLCIKTYVHVGQDPGGERRMHFSCYLNFFLTR